MKSDEAIQVIKSRINIADYARRYLNLRPAGGRLQGLCPFHQEKTPSFSVNEESGSFYCFGCHAGGDVFEFSMRINGYDFKEALEHFADELGITITRQKSSVEDSAIQRQSKQKVNAKKMHGLAAKHYKDNLILPEAQKCKSYIEERGLSPEIIDEFSLGYSKDAWHALSQHLGQAGYNDEDAVLCGLLSQSKNNNRAYDRFRNRLMFPIFSLTGQVLAFGGRIIPNNEKPTDSSNAKQSDVQEAKYINSSDTNIYKKGEHLYGLYQARKAMSLKHFAFLTEGYMDVLTLHQYGFNNAIAVLGTALTEEQVKRISGFCNKVELLFDGDNAGRNAAFKSAQMLLLAGLECKVVLFPEKEDIDSLLRQEDGLNLFASLREAAEEGLSYLIRYKKENSLLEAITWAKEFLQKVQVPEIISLYASTIAGELGVDEAEIRHQVRQKTRFASNKNTYVRGNRQENGAYNSQNKANNAPHQQQTSNYTKPLQSGLVTGKDQQRDRLIITFAVRYPNSIHKLQELGAGMILKSHFAIEMWNVLALYSPETLFNHLNSEQKTFWLQCTEGNAPPCNDESGEFFAVKSLIQKFQLQTQRQSVNIALRQSNTDIETQGIYLTALKEEHKSIHSEN